MSTATITPPAAAPAPAPAPVAAPSAVPVTYRADPSIYRFTVAQYQQMVRAGVLKADDKVELLEGYVVSKMSKNPPHEGTIDLVNAALGRVLPAGWLLRIQQATDLPDGQPEPDFAAVRGNVRSFLSRHPAPAEIGLVVEIADTSLLRDQLDKTRLYARANIPVYWIINLVDRRVEVYTQPSGPTAAPSYGAMQTFTPGTAVPLVLDGNTVAAVPVADLLP